MGNEKRFSDIDLGERLYPFYERIDECAYSSLEQLAYLKKEEINFLMGYERLTLDPGLPKSRIDEKTKRIKTFYNILYNLRRLEKGFRNNTIDYDGWNINFSKLQVKKMKGTYAFNIKACCKTFIFSKWVKLEKHRS